MALINEHEMMIIVAHINIKPILPEIFHVPNNKYEIQHVQACIISVLMNTYISVYRQLEYA